MLLRFLNVFERCWHGWKQCRILCKIDTPRVRKGIKSTDANDVKHFAKLMRKRSDNSTKIYQNPSKFHPKFIKIHENSSPATRPWKNIIFVRKSDPKTGSRFFVLGAKSDPKRHPKIMQKSTPKKYPTNMPKGSKRDAKCTKMAPEILENPYKNQCRKGIEKTSKKRWKIKPSNLENHWSS